MRVVEAWILSLTVAGTLMNALLPVGIVAVQLDELDDTPDVRAEFEDLARTLPADLELTIFERVADGRLRYLVRRLGDRPSIEAIEQLFQVVH